MTKTSVLINLVSTAHYGEGMPDLPMQLMLKGEVTVDDRKTTIRYRETDKDEESGQVIHTDIQLTVEAQQVMMERKGPFSNTMVFAKGRRFEGIYVTPFGEMDMATYTHSVHCDVTPEKGTIRLKYQLDVQGGYASTNELRLEYVADDNENVH